MISNYYCLMGGVTYFRPRRTCLYLGGIGTNVPRMFKAKFSDTAHISRQCLFTEI